MELTPRFKKVADTPWGPELKRVRPIAPEELPANPSRRLFIKTAAAAGVAAAIPLVFKETPPTVEEEVEVISEPAPEIILEKEVIPEFAYECEGYKAQVLLHKNEIVFVDEFNRPVGEPQEFTDFIADKTKADGTVMSYRYTPGVPNEVGILEDGVAREWMNYVQTNVQAEHPEQEIFNRYTVVEDFKHAYNESDEPELVAAIADGSVTRYIDIVHHFAAKPVRGAEQYSRKQYVTEAISFTEWNDSEQSGVPPVVQAELRFLLPGLCAQESKFNAGLTSKSGAKGIFQFMPATWAGYGGTPEEYTSLTKQVEIAGQFFSDLYGEVLHHVGEETLQKVRPLFADDAAFQKDFIVPLMINSYNAGSARVGEAARLFIATRSIEELPTGKELFLAMAKFAESSEDGEYLDAYGQHAREYVTRIYAQAEVLRDEDGV